MRNKSIVINIVTSLPNLLEYILKLYQLIIYFFISSVPRGSELL